MTHPPHTYQAKAPGSIMLFGEHAVLHGSPAVVAAVNQFIHVDLNPRQDQLITINSDRLGHYQNPIDTITITKPFEFVLAGILQFKQQIKTGFDLTIHSEFADNLGLGSSAAVTVATLAVLRQWLQQSNSAIDLYHQARQVIIQVQGAGSGADAAASAFGGVVAYQVTPLRITRLPLLPDVSLVYSGYKTPTKAVIAKVNQQQQQDPQRYVELYANMSQCSEHAIDAIKQQDWNTLAILMTTYQQYMQALGVSTTQLDNLINDLSKQPDILSAKISGSGLGDCIWGLGSLAANTFPMNAKQQQEKIRQINVELSPDGCQYHSLNNGTPA